MYTHNLKDAKRQTLLPEGLLDFEVVKVEEQTSSKGNMMFKVSLAKADEPSNGTDVYLLPDGKMAFLYKEFLEACGIVADEEGNYAWEISNVEGKTISAMVEHYQDKDWIDREGITQKGRMKAKIVEFKKLSV